MIGQTISHYKILEKLGEGGMGVVYKAEDTRLGRIVALKFLPPDSTTSQKDLARFQQEARAISNVNHPHIEALYDVGEADGKRFLVLEYIPGGTFKSLIKELHSAGKNFSLEEILSYGIQMADALAHAHRHGIVHRDMKTDNIMLSKEGGVKLTDFGLAKFHPGGDARLTKTGTTVGTAAYMSPEQIRGEEADQRSDIFSLGVAMYEITTNNLPFRGEHEAALQYSILNEEPMPVSSLRPKIQSSLGQIIHRCLEKDKTNRYQKAEEIVIDFRKIEQDGLSPNWRQGKRLKWPWLVAAAGIAILVLIGVYFLLAPSKSTSSLKSIAVLPFTNISGEKDEEYFSDGITEDIIAQLSNVGQLKVISRTSVMQYKSTNKNLRDIAKELNVGTVLEGSVRRAGNQVRIVAQLIDANNDQHLWAHTYDQEMKEIFAIQSDVALQIASALNAEFSPAVKERIEKKPTENLEAYAFYLRGREYYYRYRKQDNGNAIELFKKALRLDSNYALAYAGIADAYGQLASRFGFPIVWNDSALAMSQKALSIDPDLPEAHKALGLSFSVKGWTRKGIQEFRKAVELNPNFRPGAGSLGAAYSRLEELDEALKWQKKAVALGPTVASGYVGVGSTYMQLWDSANAERWLKQALELEPDFDWVHIGYGWMYLRQGRFEQAIEEYNKMLASEPNTFIALIEVGNAELLLSKYEEAAEHFQRATVFDPAISGGMGFTRLGYTYWKHGKRDQALKNFNQGLECDRKYLEQWSEVKGDPAYDIAAINAVQGDKPEAYKWLQKAIDARWRDYRFGLIDPLFENLRNDEQFKHMMALVKWSVDEMRKRAEEGEEE
jgi:serine/threonine protein kinase/Tfp pilus assembly protein PilF